jgi:hypothetical protein
MNFLNRLLVIIQLLTLIALTPIALVLVLFFRPSMGNTISNLGQGLVSSPNAILVQVIFVGVTVFVFIVAILLLYLEMQRPTARRRLHVKQVAEGQVELTEEAIVQRLERSVMEIADITRVKSHITAGRGNVVDLSLELGTSPEVNVPQKTQQVIGIAKQLMEEQLGLKVGKIRIQVDHTQPMKK